MEMNILDKLIVITVIIHLYDNVNLALNLTYIIETSLEKQI